MQPVQIAEGIWDVGVRDWSIRDFHGYSTDQGTTYNAFLIVDEKITLIDAVKKEFADQLLANIARVLDPKRIDMVVSNHTEMDHSGGLPRLMHAIGETKPVLCSAMGEKHLRLHFGAPLNLQPVQNGATMRLGKRSLTFLETRMLHWPDSMFTYVNEDQILFSSDAFGQHYAGQEKFDDQAGEAIMAFAQKYFANILLLYAPLILKLIDKVTAMGLGIRMICPDHGIVWRTDPGKIISAYARWSRQETANKAVVVYDTMWNSTRQMAEAIVEGLDGAGAAVKPMPLRAFHRSDIMTEVLDARAVVVGSPTLNNGIFPTVADLLCYMKGLKPLNRIGAAFGSYGWSGEAVKQIEVAFKEMNFKTVSPGLRLQYVPGAEAIASCRDFGRRIAEAMAQGQG